MRTTKVLALLGFASVAFTAKTSLKQKLAERGSSLAQLEERAMAATNEACPSGNCGCNATLNTACSRRLEPMAHNCTLPNYENNTAGPGLGGGAGPQFHPSQFRASLNSESTTEFEANAAESSSAYDEAVCCSTESSLHEAGSNATKVRRFCIQGDICVRERIDYEESGCAQEASAGRSRRSAIH